MVEFKCDRCGKREPAEQGSIPPKPGIQQLIVSSVNVLLPRIEGVKHRKDLCEDCRSVLDKVFELFMDRDSKLSRRILFDQIKEQQ